MTDTGAQESVVYIYGDPYIIKAETRVGDLRRLELSKFRGKHEEAKLGNLQPGLIMDFESDEDANPDNENPVVLVEDPLPVEGPDLTPYFLAMSYTPPAGAKTMKVYRLNKDDNCHWYVNRSLTKALNEQHFEGDAQFVEFDVPTTKGGLIDFLNKVCS